jgi:phage tail tape-measure protein
MHSTIGSAAEYHACIVSAYTVGTNAAVRSAGGHTPSTGCVFTACTCAASRGRSACCAHDLQLHYNCIAFHRGRGGGAQHGTAGAATQMQASTQTCVHSGCPAVAQRTSHVSSRQTQGACGDMRTHLQQLRVLVCSDPHVRKAAPASWHGRRSECALSAPSIADQVSG